LLNLHVLPKARIVGQKHGSACDGVTVLLNKEADKTLSHSPPRDARRDIRGVQYYYCFIDTQMIKAPALV